MRIPFFGDDDLENPEVPASSGQLYQRTILEFSDITSFILEYYNENTIVIPLTGSSVEVINSESISNIPDGKELNDDTDESYRRMYDYRLINPYILRNGKLNVMNVKMLGGRNVGEHGLIMRVCDIMEWVDTMTRKIPFGFADKIVKGAQKKYDARFGNGHGGYLRTVIWIPLWNICNSNAIVLTLFNRIELVLT